MKTQRDIDKNCSSQKSEVLEAQNENFQITTTKKTESVIISEIWRPEDSSDNFRLQVQKTERNLEIKL